MTSKSILTKRFFEFRDRILEWKYTTPEQYINTGGEMWVSEKELHRATINYYQVMCADLKLDPWSRCRVEAPELKDLKLE